MKPLIAALLITTLNVSCERKGSDPSDYRHFKGRLVRDCSGTPIANYNLRLYQKSSFASTNGGTRGYDTTDAEGYFDIFCPYINNMEISIAHHYGGADDFVNIVKDWDYYKGGSAPKQNVYELGTIYDDAFKGEQPG